MIFEIAGNERIPELKKIWLNCYDDPAEYVDFFFKNGFNKCRCLCAISDGCAVGALYLFECRVALSDKGGIYWYAGGVLPEYRRKGIFSKIVSYVLQLAASENKYSFCVPGPGLKEFYRNFGLKDEYYCDRFSFSCTTDSACPLHRDKPSYNELTRIAGAYSNIPGSILWNGDVFTYVAAENEYCNGFLDILTIGSIRYYVLGQLRNQALSVFVTDIPLSILKENRDSIMNTYNAERMTVQYPAAGSAMCGSERIFCALGNGGFANTDKWFVFTMI